MYGEIYTSRGESCGLCPRDFPRLNYTTNFARNKVPRAKTAKIRYFARSAFTLSRAASLEKVQSSKRTGVPFSTAASVLDRP